MLWDYRAVPDLVRSAMRALQTRFRFLLCLVLLLSPLVFPISMVASDGAADDFAPPKANRERFEQIKARAEQGEAEAQYNLGACYGNGDGVAKDMVEAVQ